MSLKEFFRKIKEFNFDEIKPYQVLLVIAVVILILPVLLSTPAYFSIFDFSETGQIGDTIGGITSPFLSALAAILVYIAFIEQVKANKIQSNAIELQSKAIELQVKANELLQNQQLENHIIEQINTILNFEINFNNIHDYIDKTIDDNRSYLATNKFLDYGKNDCLFLDEVRLLSAEFLETNRLIEMYNGEKKYFYKKIFRIYNLKYSQQFEYIVNSILEYQEYFDEKLHNQYFGSCIFDIQKLDNTFVNPYKYG